VDARRYAARGLKKRIVLMVGYNGVPVTLARVDSEVRQRLAEGLGLALSCDLPYQVTLTN